MFKKLFILAISIFIGITSLYSQDPKEIFQKYFEFKGDIKLLSEIKDIHIQATQIQAGMSVISDYYRSGEKIFIHTTSMGQESKVAYNGDTIWVMQGNQTQVIPDQYKDQVLNQFKQLEDLLIGPEPKDLDKDVELEFSGETEENARNAYVINLINNENESETFVYFDKSNYEIFKMFREITVKDDQTMTMEISFTDYKKLDKYNLKYPSKIDININGQLVSITYDKIELNPDIDESIFQKPKN